MWKEAGILVLIGVLSAGGALAFREHRSLKRQVEDLSEIAYAPRPGLFVPEVPKQTLDGDSVVLGELGRTQLLFFLNSSCPHCRASIPSWNEIAGILRDDPAVSVLGVVFGDSGTAAAYRDLQGISFSVVSAVGPRVAGLFRIHAVPSVMLLSNEGKMAYTRTGRLVSPAAVDSVISAVHVLQEQQAKGGSR